MKIQRVDGKHYQLFDLVNILLKNKKTAINKKLGSHSLINNKARLNSGFVVLTIFTFNSLPNRKMKIGSRRVAD